MAIDYTKSLTETTDQYNTRIAQARAAQPTAAAPALAPVNQTDQVNKALGGNYFDPTTGAATKPFVPAPVTPTPTVPATSSISTSTPPTLPTPSAPKAFNDYFASAATQVDGYKKSLDDTYKTQINSIQTQKDNAQAQIDTATAGQKGTLENIDTLTQPFQANLESSERQRLDIEKNYFDNQNLVDQLQTLLTDANAQEQEAEDVTGLASIRNPRIAQAKNELAGKVGVIQAVLAARNNQISVGENLIDRSVSAITADKQDQLGYYKTLLDYYGGEKSTAQGNLTKLDSDQRKYIDAQIGQAQSDLDNAQKNADTIKQLLTDPDTALLAAQAGISVTDDPATINQKLAKASYAKEVTGILNDAASSGLKRLTTPQQIASAGANVITFTDSAGKTYSFMKPVAASTAVNTSVIEVGGHKLLIDDRTGNTVKDLGASSDPAGKPLTDAQNTALGFAQRMNDANATINQLGSKFTGLTSYVTTSPLFPNFLKSADQQQYEQAQRNFVNAVLRKESGAAISPSEFDSASKQYFPQPGDSAAVISQKADNRNRAISNLAQSAGTPLESITGSVPSSSTGGDYDSYLKAIGQ